MVPADAALHGCRGGGCHAGLEKTEKQGWETIATINGRPV
jgi:hypothetical protein